MLANLISFSAFFAFIDAVFVWFFSLVNLKNFGITSIFQYTFWPFAFLMGVNIEDCKEVSNLIGIKMFVNEFVAYSHMGKMIDLRKSLIANNTFNLYLNGTLSLLEDQQIIWNVFVNEKAGPRENFLIFKRLLEFYIDLVSSIKVESSDQLVMGAL